MFEFIRASANPSVKRDTLRLNDTNDKQSQRWNVTLELDDFPSKFSQATTGQIITCNVVDGIDTNSDDNSLFIPLVLVAMNKTDDTTICYYRSRYESEAGKSLIHAVVDVAVKLSDSDSEPPEDPHALFEFHVNTDNASGTAGRLDSDREPSAFVVSHKNENANGGRDIPVEQMRRPMEPGEELHNPQNETVMQV